jgi:hypothetical protein
MSDKEPGSNRGRKSMGLRTVEVGIPVEQYELLERYAGKGGISNAIRSAVRGLLNAVDDEMFSDIFPLRWIEGAERCGVTFTDPARLAAPSMADLKGWREMERRFPSGHVLLDGEAVPLDKVPADAVEGIVRDLMKPAKPSGRGVDADRVIACLRERKRSARDVANALKMDLATAGEVLADLIRDGVVRKRADKVLELVD